MADVKAMLSIKTLLQTAQGATGDMLAEGLVHALQDGPEERHELQAALLKMVNQVLCSTRDDALRESEDTCKSRVDEESEKLNACKAAVAEARSNLEQAKATSASQKDNLEHAVKQRAFEEEEHLRVDALDQEKAQEVATVEAGWQEVVTLLDLMKQKGHGETIIAYLLTAKAEAPLIAALQSVLKKEAEERNGFDTVSMEHLQLFLTQKVAEWNATVQEVAMAKANIHAEAVGAWAVKEVAIENVKQAVKELEAAQIVEMGAEKALKDAVKAEQQQDRVLNHYLTDLTLAHERVRQCSEALEKLAVLEKGVPNEVEVPVAKMDIDMDVDMDAKMDTMQDVNMGTAITA